MLLQLTEAPLASTFLLLLLLLPLFSSAQEGYDLVATRVQGTNNYEMACTQLPEHVIMTDVDFFRNGIPFPLPMRRNVMGVAVFFTVDRDSEGLFTCGRVRNFETIQSAPQRTVVGELSMHNMTSGALIVWVAGQLSLGNSPKPTMN